MKHVLPDAAAEAAATLRLLDKIVPTQVPPTFQDQVLLHTQAPVPGLLQQLWQRHRWPLLGLICLLLLDLLAFRALTTDTPPTFISSLAQEYGLSPGRFPM